MSSIQYDESSRFSRPSESHSTVRPGDAVTRAIGHVYHAFCDLQAARVNARMKRPGHFHWF